MIGGCPFSSSVTTPETYPPVTGRLTRSGVVEWEEDPGLQVEGPVESLVVRSGGRDCEEPELLQGFLHQGLHVLQVGGLGFVERVVQASRTGWFPSCL